MKFIKSVLWDFHFLMFFMSFDLAFLGIRGANLLPYPSLCSENTAFICEQWGLGCSHEILYCIHLNSHVSVCMCGYYIYTCTYICELNNGKEWILYSLALYCIIYQNVFILLLYNIFSENGMPTSWSPNEKWKVVIGYCYCQSCLDYTRGGLDFWKER